MALVGAARKIHLHDNAPALAGVQKGLRLFRRGTERLFDNHCAQGRKCINDCFPAARGCGENGNFDGLGAWKPGARPVGLQAMLRSNGGGCFGVGVDCRHPVKAGVIGQYLIV